MKMLEESRQGFSQRMCQWDKYQANNNVNEGRGTTAKASNMGKVTRYYVMLFRLQNNSTTTNKFANVV